MIGECPKGLAWADKAYATDLAHQLSECSSAGTCDRTSGKCQCFPGFAGNACQRSKLIFVLCLFMLNFVSSLPLSVHSFVIENWLGGCPNACSGHGSCATLGDLTLYQGLNQNLSTSYSNWDKSSITVCNCDDGYFGADCSLGMLNFIINYIKLNLFISLFYVKCNIAMCPKGDDPMTMDQNYRQIQMTVTNTRHRLQGTIGMIFQGKISYISLLNPSDTDCMEGLTNSRSYGLVGCTVTNSSAHKYVFNIIFYYWPAYPTENNLYFHDGNPPISSFSCDTVLTDAGVTCSFEDIVSTNILGKCVDCHY